MAPASKSRGGGRRGRERGYDAPAMVVLVTGFPTSFLATRVVRKLLAEDPDLEVRCVVPSRFLERAEQVRASLAPDARPRLTVLEGDVTALDMGLSGAEYTALAREVTRIHHCAAATYLGVDRAAAERLNVGGARELLELADDAHHRASGQTRFDRLVHWSSALVAGSRRGIVREDELVRSGFRNAVEETRHAGEELVRRAMKRGLPVTVLRPSILVGDSKTGEIDRLEGPYLLILLMLSTPIDLRVPLPGRGDVPLNLVPIDYVVDAGCAIAADARSVGRTFHLVDPRPATARLPRAARGRGRLRRPEHARTARGQRNPLPGLRAVRRRDGRLRARAAGQGATARGRHRGCDPGRGERSAGLRARSRGLGGERAWKRSAGVLLWSGRHDVARGAPPDGRRG